MDTPADAKASDCTRCVGRQEKLKMVGGLCAFDDAEDEVLKSAGAELCDRLLEAEGWDLQPVDKTRATPVSPGQLERLDRVRPYFEAGSSRERPKTGMTRVPSCAVEELNEPFSIHERSLRTEPHRLSWRP
ncbi:hypothetical protein ACNF49_14580 [Actinomadura sp. ATCC 39365]